MFICIQMVTVNRDEKEADALSPRSNSIWRGGTASLSFADRIFEKLFHINARYSLANCIIAYERVRMYSCC